MDQSLLYFLWLAVGIFVVTFVIQLVFPVEVYEHARGSNMGTVQKGLFAHTVEALYQIRSKGLDADGKYWWHIIWFNTTVSLGVSAVVIFGIIVLMVIVAVIGAIILLVILGNT